MWLIQCMMSAAVLTVSAVIILVSDRCNGHVIMIMPTLGQVPVVATNGIN